MPFPDMRSQRQPQVMGAISSGARKTRVKISAPSPCSLPNLGLSFLIWKMRSANEPPHSTALNVRGDSVLRNSRGSGPQDTSVNGSRHYCYYCPPCMQHESRGVIVSFSGLTTYPRPCLSPSVL